MFTHIRRHVTGVAIIILLALFFGTLYLYSVRYMERYAAERVDSLAKFSATLIEERLDMSAEILRFLLSLASREKDFGRSFLLSAGNAAFLPAGAPGGDMFLQSRIAMLLQGRELMYFDEDSGIIVATPGGACMEWMTAMASASGDMAVKGPLPPLVNSGHWMLLFVRAIPGAKGERRGALALCLPLELLTHRLFATDGLGAAEQRFFLVNEENRVIFPPPQDNPPPEAQDVPMLRTMPKGPFSDKNSLVRHSVEGVEYIAGKAAVGDTGWELFVFSPASREFRLQSFLLAACVGGWLCICLFMLLLLFQTRRQVHYKVLSEIDHLTGAGNRLAFEKYLARMGSQNRFPFCLIMMDVDGLKIINDRLGHQAGDALLRRATFLLQRSLRENDTVYRIGGDEFAVIVPGATYNVAQPLTERITMQTALLREKGELPPIFISCGLAEARDPESFASLFKRADMAMYTNKQMRHKTTSRAITQWVEKHPDQLERRKKPLPVTSC